MRRSRAATTLAATATGLIVLAVWGLSMLIPLLLLGLTGAFLCHGASFSPAPPGSPLDRWEPQPSSVAVRPSGPSALPLARWSEVELRRAWQVTYIQLQRRPGAAWTEHLAEQRRTYLGELQRRDPGGFAAWISSGARAAGDPTRYLTSPPRTS